MFQAAASGKRRCATVQSEPSPIKNAKYDISLSAYKQDQTASSMDTSNQRTSEVKSVCHRIQGNTSEMKTAHNLSQDTSSQSHEKYGPEIEAFTSLRRPVGGYNNETKLDSAHENKAQPKTIDPTNRANAVSHTSNGSKLTSSLNQSRNNDSEDSILGHGEVRRQSESTTVHNKCVIMGDVKKEQNRNTGSCDSQRRSTPVTCPCGANKKRCRKWKKSKRGIVLLHLSENQMERTLYLKLSYHQLSKSK